VTHAIVREREARERRERGRRERQRWEGNVTESLHDVEGEILFRILEEAWRHFDAGSAHLS